MAKPKSPNLQWLLWIRMFSDLMSRCTICPSFSFFRASAISLPNSTTTSYERPLVVLLRRRQRSPPSQNSVTMKQKELVSKISWMRMVKSELHASWQRISLLRSSSCSAVLKACRSTTLMQTSSCVYVLMPTQAYPDIPLPTRWSMENSQGPSRCKRRFSELGGPGASVVPLLSVVFCANYLSRMGLMATTSAFQLFSNINCLFYQSIINSQMLYGQRQHRQPSSLGANHWGWLISKCLCFGGEWGLNVLWRFVVEPIILNRSRNGKCLLKILFSIIIIQYQSTTQRPAPQADTPRTGELRRSARERKQPKNEDYFMGSYALGEAADCGYFEEEQPKRRRNHYYLDDSEDYSEGHRHARRSKQPNINKVEALLEWRNQLEMAPVTINYLPEQKEIAIEQLTHAVITTSIAGENLSALAEDLLAIFVNIEWNQKGQTLQDFEKVRLQSSRLMSKGMVFVWTPKEHISQMLAIMEQKHFQYVQNFETINFDINKARLYTQGNRRPTSEEKLEDKTLDEEVQVGQLIKALIHVNPCDLIADSSSPYFNASKRTLLMFKKNSAHKFQLRHQRTCDVVFDMPMQLGQKCEPDLKAYIYNMIETLLPEGLILTLNSNGQPQFRMMELWADKDEYRRGWVSVVEEE